MTINISLTEVLLAMQLVVLMLVWLRLSVVSESIQEQTDHMSDRDNNERVASKAIGFLAPTKEDGY